MTATGKNKMRAASRVGWNAMLAGMCLCAASASALIAGFVGFASSLERSESNLMAQAEGVVALTGGSDRVLEAAGLLARGQARRLLITGVNRATHGADLEKILPVSKDLFACCVDLGYQAQDTAGNARETRDWAKAHGVTGTLIVVTSNYHMPRALVELSAVLPDYRLYPFPVVTEHVNVADWPRDPRVLKLLGREYLKYLRAVIKTRWEAAGLGETGEACGRAAAGAAAVPPRC